MSDEQRREEAGFDGGLVTGALRMGRLVWVERSLATALGTALGRTDDDALVVALADRIRGHVARAALVEARLPTLREFPLDTLTGGAGLDGWSEYLESLDEVDAAAVLAARDTVVLPLVVAAYDRVLSSASPVGAPSMRRTLAPVVAELSAELDRSGDSGRSDQVEAPVPTAQPSLEPLDR